MEIKMAVFLAEHNIYFNVVNHLTELVKDGAKCPEAIMAVSLKKIKATNIIKNVTGKCCFDNLVK